MMTLLNRLTIHFLSETVSILYQLFQMSGGGNRGETVVINSESPECVSHEQTALIHPKRRQ